MLYFTDVFFHIFFIPATQLFIVTQLLLSHNYLLCDSKPRSTVPGALHDIYYFIIYYYYNLLLLLLLLFIYYYLHDIFNK